MIIRFGAGFVCAALAVAAGACGGTETEPVESTTAETAADHTEHTAAGATRVFFVEPKDGQTVKSDVTLVFGSEGDVKIAAVPPGEITEADVRPGVAHYHVAVDTPCLPAGEIIPKADPWVHFGSGANTADITLTPGTHMLTVQGGNDQHRTVEGLCETITVTVEG